ncbi:MAG: heparinase II/III-family protein, partial [Bacteroidales bacterium]|nr:heparinase II/III-family protein [Bacteroidales bacterium]
SFILYLDQTPILIDAGAGVYTKQTFSKDRYSIWTMQSDYHNLPMINGTSQSYGPQFRSSDIAFDSVKSRFSLNLRKAYPQSAAVKKWIRTYQLKNEGLIIEDVFELTETKAPNELHFLTAGEPQTTTPGIIMLDVNGIKLKMKYNKDQFEPTIETISLNDPSLSRSWGGQIYRLKLTAKKQQLIGKYLITITK